MNTDAYFEYLNDVLIYANRVLFLYMHGNNLLAAHTPKPPPAQALEPGEASFPLCRLAELYSLNDFQIYCIALALLYESRQDYSVVFSDANDGNNVPDLSLARRSYEYSYGTLDMRDFLNGWSDELVGQLLKTDAGGIPDTRLVLNRRIYAFLLCEESYDNSRYAHIFSFCPPELMPLDDTLKEPYDKLLRALKNREEGTDYFFYVIEKASFGRESLVSAVFNALGKSVIFVNLCSLAYDNETQMSEQIAAIKRECLLQNAVAIAVDFEYLMKKSKIPNSAVLADMFARSMLSVWGYAVFICESIIRFGSAAAVYIELEGAAIKKLNPAGLEMLKSKACLIEPRFEPEDLVLPQNQKWLLDHICNYVALKNTVYGDWGFGKRFVYGRGLNVLFAGPPGTGKTMAAQIISKRLGLPLYKIDLAQIVSKYIGETEENLRIIFDEAERSDIVLMIDEMDALFGKRTKTRDSHDRHANMETSYLLQRIESFDGIVLMATNLLKNVDDAFMRRLSFVVHFPFPSAEMRKQLWQGLVKSVPVDDSVDFDFLAEKFEISGGLIKNVVLKAAFLAASQGRPVNDRHILSAMKDELAKQGKVLISEDFL